MTQTRRELVVLGGLSLCLLGPAWAGGMAPGQLAGADSPGGAPAHVAR